jgi:hypothetical protein
MIEQKTGAELRAYSVARAFAVLRQQGQKYPGVTL